MESPKLAYGPAVFSGISIVALTWLIPYIFYPKNHISSFSGWMLGIAWVLDVAATLISIITMVWTMTSIAKGVEKTGRCPLDIPSSFDPGLSCQVIIQADAFISSM